MKASSSPNSSLKSGATVSARHDAEAKWQPATFLESKRLHNSDEIWCFVRWRDSDRRMASWVPSSCVDVDGSNRGSQITDVILSKIASTRIPGNKRAEGPIMEYLEERLGRDIRSPNPLRYFHFAGYTFQPWYFSPFGTLYPEYNPESETLHDAFVCPFTLKPFPTRAQLDHETAQYTATGAKLAPPGHEVYRDNEAGVSLLEVDGRAHRTFCRNMFLMCKSFLENKLAGHDVDLYLFYVVALHANKHAPPYISKPDNAMLFAGFYSYEKAVDEYNLACIVTLPCFQGMGLGNFLISASYEYAYRRRCIGTPERPLSELGEVAYDRYWWVLIARFFAKMVDLRWTTDVDREDGEAGAQNYRPDGEDGGAAADETISLTVHEVANRVRLEEADVLATMLKRGLIHRTENRQMRIVVPVKLVREVNAKHKASSLIFQPTKLSKN